MAALTLALPAAALAAAVEKTAEPTAADFAAYAPPRALRERLDGKATLECDVSTSGRLTNCKVVAEDPPRVGFGDSALRLAPLYRFRSDAEDEVRVRVVVPFRYSTAPAQTPPTQTAAASAPLATAPLATAPPAPKPVTVPDAVARLTPPAGRLLALGAVPGWSLEFADLERVTRAGDTVEAVRLSALATGGYEVTGVRLACGARVHTLTGAQTFDAAGARTAWRGPGEPIANAPGSVWSALAAALCPPGAPTPTHTGLDAALAAAKRALGSR